MLATQLIKEKLPQTLAIASASIISIIFLYKLFSSNCSTTVKKSEEIEDNEKSERTLRKENKKKIDDSENESTVYKISAANLFRGHELDSENEQNDQISLNESRLFAKKKAIGNNTRNFHSDFEGKQNDAAKNTGKRPVQEKKLDDFYFAVFRHMDS